MQETKTLSEVARILGTTRARIEMMISRELFLEPIFTTPGVAREWTLLEVFRLAVFLRLIDAGVMTAREAGILTQNGFNRPREDDFLVAYKRDTHKYSSWASKIVSAKDLGEFLARKCEYPRLIQTRPRGEPPKKINPKYGPAHVAIILNLSEISKDLAEKW